MNKIITHPGKAHFDEFISICLILSNSVEDFFIERKEPTKKELNDPNTWVVDVGEKYEPTKKNFDHHQDKNLNCSYILVANYLNLNFMNSQNIPWWDIKSDLDTKGSTYVKQMNLTQDEFFSVGSPLENFILEKFSENPNSMINFMRDFGFEIMESASKIKTQIEIFKNDPIIIVNNQTVLIHQNSNILGLDQYIKKSQSDIAAIVFYDDRGLGWAFLRLFDNPHVDFLNLKNSSKIKFVHNNGFIAKTYQRISLKEIFELLSKSIK